MDKDISIYITSHIENQIQLLMLKTAIEYAHKYYPNSEIIIIDDNSKINIPMDELRSCHPYLCYIKSEFPGAGELLRLYYYLKYGKTKWAICVHDSQFINSKFDIPKDFPFQFLFTAKHIYDTPLEELNLVSHINDKNLTLFYHKEKTSWKVAFGAQCIVKKEFLEKIDKKLPGFFNNFIPSIKSRVDRMCCERIISVVFNYINKKPNKKYMFGDIFSYARKMTGKKDGWGYTFEEFLQEKNNKRWDSIPTIKVWVGR